MIAPFGSDSGVSGSLPRKVVAVLTMVALVAIAVKLGSAELRYRQRLARQYLEQKVTFVVRNQEDAPGGSDDQLLGLPRSVKSFGPAKPNRHLRVTIITAEDLKIVLDHDTPTNNLGFLSSRPYTVAKPANEFRIVVHGDSMTGTVTSGFEWVDRTEDILGRDPEFRSLIGGKSVRVYNLGYPGSSFARMERDYEHETTVLSPDLVIVNFTESTFQLTVSERMRMSLPETGYVQLREGDRSALVEMTCSGGEISLDNPDCYQWFGILADRDFYTSHDMMRGLQRDIMKRYVAAKMSWRNTYAYSLAARFGKLASFVEYKPPITAANGNFTDAVLAQLAAKSLSMLMAHRADVMLTAMPLYWDYVPATPGKPYPRIRGLEGDLPNVTIHYMDRRMPYRAGEPDLDREVIASWYNVPYDGHPSDIGAELYARAMAGAIKDHLQGAAASAPHRAPE
jgi:hypothetical protein